MARHKLTHVDDDGHVQMVDVSHKQETERTAVARALLRCTRATRDALMSGSVEKGEALATARVAGILAAKRTGELIPMCHPLALTDVAVDLVAHADGIAIEATARTVGRTGVEMEAMVAAAIAGLTLYDMGKAIERGMILDAVRLVEKRGGKSGVWRRDDVQAPTVAPPGWQLASPTRIAGVGGKAPPTPAVPPRHTPRAVGAKKGARRR